LKYKTVFNWLCISFNGKEQFWQNLKRDYENDKLDCYEVRLEEIVNICTSISRKYWRSQRTISSRRKRTQLFQSEIFKNRRTHFQDKHQHLSKGSNFNSLVLAELKEHIQMHLGFRFEGVDFEEKVLYNMASICDMFGSGMFRYREKKLLKFLLLFILMQVSNKILNFIHVS
jgi:hypothetical protein